MPTQTRHTQKPRLEEGGQSNQFASPSLLRTPVVGPTLLGSCLGHCLEHRRWAIILHEPSHCISRAIQHHWQYVIVPGCYGNCLFYAPNLLYLLKGLYLVWGISFLIVRGCQCLMSENVQNSEGCLRLFRVNPDAFPHFLTPQALLMIPCPLTSHHPSHRVNPSRTAHCQGEIEETGRPL